MTVFPSMMLLPLTVETNTDKKQLPEEGFKWESTCLACVSARHGRWLTLIITAHRLERRGNHFKFKARFVHVLNSRPARSTF